MISRLNIDIIDTQSFKTLGILDTSWYNPDIIVEQATLEIVPPGYAKAVIPYWIAKSFNIYNSNSVGITKASCEDELVDLPDGIWKFKYSICPNDQLFIERAYLKTDKIRCKYTQAFLNLDLSNLGVESEKQKRRELDEIGFYIDGAVAASNAKDFKLASDFYKRADKLLGRYFSDSNICGC